jgi:hypothetical protein
MYWIDEPKFWLSPRLDISWFVCCDRDSKSLAAAANMLAHDICISNQDSCLFMKREYFKDQDTTLKCSKEAQNPKLKTGLRCVLSRYLLCWFNVLRWIRCLCDVTLSVYPHRTGLKNMPGHGGNRACDLWNTSPIW